MNQRRRLPAPEVGHVLGRLTFVAIVDRPEDVTNTGQYSLWKCECGADKVARLSMVLNGNTKSCGCLGKEKLALRTKHGELINSRGNTRSMYMYSAWRYMRHKLHRVGVKVCAEWDADFAAFRRDMGEPPSDGHVVKRIDDRGDYCKSNCVWVYSANRVSNTKSYHERLEEQQQSPIEQHKAALSTLGIRTQGN